MRQWLILSFVTASLAVAADRPDLSGTWQFEAKTLLIQQKDDSVQFTETDGKDKTLDFHCNTLGKECKVEGGTVSLYYNGPVLVLLEMKHGNDMVIKRRLKPSEDGKSMDVEVMHIAPPGEPEKYKFTRQADATTAMR